jgi:hypothetical protein
MSAISIPPPTQPLTSPDTGAVTEPWYRVLNEISRLRTELDALYRLTEGMGAADAYLTGTATVVGST